MCHLQMSHLHSGRDIAKFDQDVDVVLLKISRISCSKGSRLTRLGLGPRKDFGKENDRDLHEQTRPAFILGL